jgi:hypothetical protein
MLFRAQMLARKLISLGRSWWLTPCRARNATSRPCSVPRISGAEGAPKGVVISSARGARSSAMEYRPVPPMMPIIAMLPAPVAPARRAAARCLKSVHTNSYPRVVAGAGMLAHPVRIKWVTGGQSA